MAVPQQHLCSRPPCMLPFDQAGAAQVVNLAAFLAANCVAASSYCTMFSKTRVWLNLVMWTCWNTVAPRALDTEHQPLKQGHLLALNFPMCLPCQGGATVRWLQCHVSTQTQTAWCWLAWHGQLLKPCSRVHGLAAGPCCACGPAPCAHVPLQHPELGAVSP